MNKLFSYIMLAFILTLIVVSIYIAMTRQSEPLKEGSPERTVQIYIDNILKDEPLKAYELISEDIKDNCLYTEFNNTFHHSYNRSEVETTNLVKVEIVDGEAIVTVEASSIETSIPLGSTERKSRHTYVLVKEDMEWKIVETSFPIYCS